MPHIHKGQSEANPVRVDEEMELPGSSGQRHPVGRLSVAGIPEPQFGDGPRDRANLDVGQLAGGCLVTASAERDARVKIVALTGLNGAGNRE